MTTQRREFLKAAAVAPTVTVPYLWTSAARAAAEQDKLQVASIGVGGRGSGIGRQAARLGQMVACCDADKNRAMGFAKPFGCDVYQDYRQVLDRKDIDVITIGTPDHWHVKIAIEAMQAGKDVYCEKPLTLTVDEGKLAQKAVNQTGRSLQDGTQQRSEYASRFLKAVVIARSGRLGAKLKAISSVGRAQKGGPFAESDPPAHLDWNLWLGQAPMTPYILSLIHI